MPAPILFRPAVGEDARAISYLHAESWRTTYAGVVASEVLENLSFEARAVFWSNHLHDSNRTTVEYVAVDGVAGVVGFASSGAERDGIAPFSSELYAIYFLEPYQGHGFGKSLVHQIAREMISNGHRSMLVWVLIDNASRHFYTALGGRQVASKMITIGPDELEEVAYGWEELTSLTDRLEARP